MVSKNRKVQEETLEPEEDLIELSLEKRPILSLKPRSDGHYLDMKVEKLLVPEAKILEYEFFYNVAGSTQPQGSQGSIPVDDKKSIEEELLLGTESSGKFRYDANVEGGTVTLKFRNDAGKVVTKFESNFRMYQGSSELKSADDKFVFMLDKKSSDFFVVMDSVGLPDGYPGNVNSGPYYVLSSATSKNSGRVTLSGNVSYWDGSSWKSLEDDKSPNIGIFASVE